MLLKWSKFVLYSKFAIKVKYFQLYKVIKAGKHINLKKIICSEPLLKLSQVSNQKVR